MNQDNQYWKKRCDEAYGDKYDWMTKGSSTKKGDILYKILVKNRFEYDLKKVEYNFEHADIIKGNMETNGYDVEIVFSRIAN